MPNSRTGGIFDGNARRLVHSRDGIGNFRRVPFQGLGRRAVPEFSGRRSRPNVRSDCRPLGIFENRRARPRFIIEFIRFIYSKNSHEIGRSFRVASGHRKSIVIPMGIGVGGRRRKESFGTRNEVRAVPIFSVGNAKNRDLYRRNAAISVESRSRERYRPRKRLSFGKRMTDRRRRQIAPQTNGGRFPYVSSPVDRSENEGIFRRVHDARKDGSGIVRAFERRRAEIVPTFPADPSARTLVPRECPVRKTVADFLEVRVRTGNAQVEPRSGDERIGFGSRRESDVQFGKGRIDAENRIGDVKRRSARLVDGRYPHERRLRIDVSNVPKVRSGVGEPRGHGCPIGAGI